MQKRIFLRAYCHHNLGDDLFIHIICKRYPDVMFYIMMKHEFVKGFLEIPNLRIFEVGLPSRIIDKTGNFLFKQSLYTRMIVKKCDATVMIGGSMFMEDEKEKWRDRLNDLIRLRSWSKNFFVIGANFGPYTTDEFLQNHLSFFTTCNEICVRDHWSENLLHMLNNVRCAPDIVLNLKQSEVKREHKITIVPIQLKRRNTLDQYQEQYLYKMAELASSFLRNGWDVTFVAFCREQGDEEIVMEILNQLSDKQRAKIHSVIYRGDIISVLSELASSEVIITSRFHGMILGWLFKARVIPIVYDQKMLHVMNDFGYKGQFFSVEDIGKLHFDLNFDEIPVMNVDSFIADSVLQFKNIDQYLESKL